MSVNGRPHVVSGLDEQYRYLLRMLRKNLIERIDVWVSTESSGKEKLQQLGISELINRRDKSVHLFSLSSIFEGTEIGDSISMRTICWQRIDVSGNLKDVSRHRISHTPSKTMDAEDAVLLSKTLVVQVAEKYLRDLGR